MSSEASEDRGRPGGTEFVSLKERLEDMEDLLQLRKAKKTEGRKRSVPLASVKRQLGLR